MLAKVSQECVGFPPSNDFDSFEGDSTKQIFQSCTDADAMAVNWNFDASF